MLAKAHGFTVFGIDGHPVHIEVDLDKGLPAYAVVGLPDPSIRESRERVVAALRNSGFDFPAKRVTVNLAPAELRKTGAQLDLPIALAILAASGQLEAARPTGRVAMVGELGLDGGLRPVFGALAMAIRAAEDGFEAIVVPRENTAEAAAAPIPVLPAATLREVTRHVSGDAPLPPALPEPPPPAPEHAPDLCEVRGQAFAKRALEVAAAGGHNLILVGPPGAGKSMLARRLPGILPPMTAAESLEATRIHSVLGLLPARGGCLRERPFRAPHHTVSDAALVGGGIPPRPGEISLAHGGVLFLDELPEFRRDVLEALRQPLEAGRIPVARACGTATFPARFILAAAMNPCPCGYAGHPTRECACTPVQARRYRNRVSGPLWDRIDLHVEMAPISFDEFTGEDVPGGEGSAAVRARVLKARAVQAGRFAGTKTACNARMSARQARAHCRLDGESRAFLEKAMQRLGLSARSLDRLLRVARTLADLDGAPDIARGHVSEAVQFRSLDRISPLLKSG